MRRAAVDLEVRRDLARQLRVRSQAVMALLLEAIVGVEVGAAELLAPTEPGKTPAQAAVAQTMKVLAGAARAAEAQPLV